MYVCDLLYAILHSKHWHHLFILTKICSATAAKITKKHIKALKWTGICWCTQVSDVGKQMLFNVWFLKLKSNAICFWKHIILLNISHSHIHLICYEQRLEKTKKLKGCGTVFSGWEGILIQHVLECLAWLRGLPLARGPLSKCPPPLLPKNITCTYKIPIQFSIDWASVPQFTVKPTLPASGTW